jgi:vancomycin resistance protein VanJ
VRWPGLNRFLVGLFYTLTALYALLLVALLAVQVLRPDAQLNVLTRSALALLLYPGIVLLFFAVLLRRWRVVLMLALPALAFLIVWGPLFLPRSGAATVEMKQISVMTFNIHGYSQNLDTLGSIIRSSNADVVAVQELSFEAQQYFADNLADIYPYQSLHPEEIAYAGQGVLSRYPIDSDEYWRPEDQHPITGYQRVILNIDGRQITVYNAHPPTSLTGHGFDIAPHSRGVEDLLQRIDADSGPLIVLGDFNMTEQFGNYEELAKRFTDTYRESGQVGPGFTFPAAKHVPLPVIRRIALPAMLRLDYIFHNNYFKGIDARVWPQSGLSDHYPVRAVLEFSGN